MQAVGVLLLTVAVWLVYCGVTGVAPLATGLLVLASPANAASIIAAAKSDAQAESNTVTSGFTLTSGGIKDYISGANPFAGIKLSGTWNDHLARDSAGGLDYPMPVGTRLVTPFPGVATYTTGSGSGGYIMTVTMANGYKSQYLHCSGALVLNGQKVTAGQAVALSGGAKGAPGAGASTGPHVHWHMVDPQGKRINPLDYLPIPSLPSVTTR
jgi:murein DD-endopeptidase MepM/ murein hydrolase activator NlpD